MSEEEKKTYIMLEAQIKYSEKLWKEKEELQQRIDKAIEYIKSCEWSNGIDNEMQYSLHIPTLLKILGDKE